MDNTAALAQSPQHAQIIALMQSNDEKNLEREVKEILAVELGFEKKYSHR